MEHCFRIVASMLLLVGYLQAKPTPQHCRMNMEDLGFDLLDDVSCEKNVTFTSPVDVEEKCYNASLEHFKKELERAEEKCDNRHYIRGTLEALKLDCCKPTNCSLTLKSHEKFEGFRKSMETFVQKVYVQQCKEQ